MEEARVEQAVFRRVMSRFVTGVTVVTTSLNGNLYGATVNAFSSVSLEPPLVLVCLDRLSRTRQVVGESGIFGVNILSWQQQFLADRFAGRAPLVNTAFTGVPYRLEATGTPILEGTLAWADCTVTDTVQAGDHAIFVGSALSAGLDEEREPLLYFRGRFRRLPLT